MVPLLRNPCCVCFFQKQRHLKKSVLRFTLCSMVFAKKPYTGRVRVCVLLLRENYRIAKCGTTNESASAGFFVSPKTKNCRTGCTHAAENSEITLFAIDFHAHFDTIRAWISHMRKGAAGYVGCILSSAIVLVAHLRMSLIRSLRETGGFFSFVVVDNLPQRYPKSNMQIQSYPQYLVDVEKQK